MRAGSILMITLCVSPLVSCRAVVDPGVTYRACDRDPYAEEFSKGTTLKDLSERCWVAANTEDNPDDIFLDDGDLVIRVTEPTNGQTKQWSGDEQGPMLFQHFEKDFLVATRVEAVDQVFAGHCLEEGNTAGLVVRRSAPDLGWSTFLIGPFTPDNPDPNLDCTDGSVMEYPTMGVLRRHDDAAGAEIIEKGVDQRGIGVDGEADLAVCRYREALLFYYRDRMSTEAASWIMVGSHDAGSGALDVGLTAAGAGEFEVEGHFTWSVYDDGIGADGCAGALEGLTLPPEE